MAIDVSTAAEFAALAAGVGSNGNIVDVNITADIDMTGVTMRSAARSYMNLYGNNHTISNLTVSTTGDYFLFQIYSGSIKDLKLSGCNITAGRLFLVNNYYAAISNFVLDETCITNSKGNQTNGFITATNSSLYQVAVMGTHYFTNTSNYMLVGTEIRECFIAATIYCVNRITAFNLNQNKRVLFNSFTKCKLIGTSNNASFEFMPTVSYRIVADCYSADTFTNCTPVAIALPSGKQSTTSFYDGELNAAWVGDNILRYATTSQLKSTSFLSLVDDANSIYNGWAVDDDVTAFNVTTEHGATVYGSNVEDAHIIPMAYNVTLKTLTMYIKSNAAGAVTGYLSIIDMNSNTTLVNNKRLNVGTATGAGDLFTATFDLGDGVDFTAYKRYRIYTSVQNGAILKDTVGGQRGIGYGIITFAADYSGPNKPGIYEMTFENAEAVAVWKVDSNNDGYPWIWGFAVAPVGGNIFLKQNNNTIPMTAYIKQNGNLIPLTFSGVKGAGI